MNLDYETANTKLFPKPKTEAQPPQSGGVSGLRKQLCVCCDYILPLNLAVIFLRISNFVPLYFLISC